MDALWQKGREKMRRQMDNPSQTVFHDNCVLLRLGEIKTWRDLREKGDIGTNLKCAFILAGRPDNITAFGEVTLQEILRLNSQLPGG